MSFFGSRGMREGVMERDPSNEWIEATNLKLFKVEPKFEATAEWAQFNVETVNALDDGRDGKPELRPAAEVRAALLGLTKQFYAGGGDDAPAFFGRGRGSSGMIGGASACCCSCASCARAYATSPVSPSPGASPGMVHHGAHQ